MSAWLVYFLFSYYSAGNTGCGKDMNSITPIKFIFFKEGSTSTQTGLKFIKIYLKYILIRMVTKYNIKPCLI
ncbi:hypothetical protein GYH30_045376 [Glycine max]|nr:hypothetical protein GYH30_045376 [Glycine max]